MSSFLLSGGSRPKTGVKALFVDPDLTIVNAFGAALRARGGQSLEATTFEAAKQLWIAEKPHILIADVRLGQFNGLQLLLRAKADRPDVVAVITCAVADKVLEIDTRRFGGTYLVKPLVPEQVLETLLAPSTAVPLERFEERRTGERRVTSEPGFVPNRRLSERRRPKRD